MKYLLVLFSLIVVVHGQSTVELLDDTLLTEVPEQHNPVLTTSLSIIPGVGAFATKHWGHGTLMLGSNALFWAGAFTQRSSYLDYQADIAIEKAFFLDTISTADSLVVAMQEDTTLDSAVQHDSLVLLGTKLMSNESEYGLLLMEESERRTRMMTWFIWAGSMYYWNLLDGYSVSNTFRGNENPTPRRALALAAIPFTGAGQWYNGKPFKAGFISSVQIAFALSAINWSLYRGEVEEYGVKLNNQAGDIISGGDTLLITDAQEDTWKDRYEDAGTTRTQFLWYGVIFYLYGMVDAYVDAKLFGFHRKFDITAGYDPIKQGVGLQLTGSF